MKQPDSHRVRRSIARFRKITLVGVLVIMAINFVMVQGITTSLDHGAAPLIYDAWRMCMLSQRIRSSAFEIDTAVRNEDWEELEDLHADLVEGINDFTRIYEEIFLDPGRLSGMVYDDQQLDLIHAIRVPYQRIVSAGRELELLTRSTIRRSPYIDQLTRTRISSMTQETRAAQDAFLPRMNRVVNMFDRKANDEIRQGTRRARLGLFVLALMLAALVLFVIEPSILIVRRQLRELDRATREIRRADSVRWRLLTNMGHEFRTPMNAILGFTDLLDDESLSASERNRLVRSVRESARQLSILIETMLDMSAIETGQLRISTSPTRVRDILAPCIELARPRADAAGLELVTELDESCDRVVVTEPKKLRQIVNKLIDNAIKFTPKGRVTIEARVLEENDEGTILITVADTGIGIPPDQISHIFDPFHQAQNNLTRAYGGSGLGLALARDLARALGGDIRVQSTPDAGSTFTLSIHTRLEAQSDDHTGTTARANPTGSPGAPDSLANARLLIVDDAKDNRILLRHFFRNTDARIDFANDGMQAVQCAREAIEANDPYNLILMDMQMPVLDGYEATGRLRASGVNTPIVALTAHALDGDREKCLQAGCDEYLSKPVSRSTLIETCERMLKIDARNDATARRAA